MPAKKLLIAIVLLITLLPVNFGVGFFAGYKIGFNKSQTMPTINQLQNLGPYFLPKEGIVTQVNDGDTIEITAVDPIGQGLDRVSSRSVRYLGIDAPNAGEDKFEEAKIYNERLVLGKKVTLEYDTPQNDKYGRILAWIWLDGKLINKEMIISGLAKPLTIDGQRLKYDLTN